jgi:hypothetical protein
MKSLLRSQLVQRCLARLLGCYLWLSLVTTRWTLHGAEHFAPHGAGASAVFGFWHENLPLMPAFAMLARRSPDYRHAPIYTLVSQHRDGRSIGAIVRRFGIEPVFGSSTRGGGMGLLQLVHLLRAGAMIGITPDGPRGPRRQAAPGIAQLAALAGVPVLPCAASTSRRIVLKTWDRMPMPLPFGRGVVVCGPAIMVPRDGWRDAVPAIAAAMDLASVRADHLRGGG